MERDKVFKAGVCDLLPARLAGPEEREGHTSYVTVRKVARRVSEINWEAVCVRACKGKPDTGTKSLRAHFPAPAP